MKQLLRFLPSLLVLLAALTQPEDAHAQSITLDARNGFDIERVDDRSTNERPNWISREDCFDASPNRFHVDVGTEYYTWLHFQPYITGYKSTDTVEVWVSQTANCADQNIIDGNAQSCTLVGGAKIKRNPELYVNPRDVIEKNSSLKQWPGEPDDPAGSENTCDKQLDQALTFYILVRRGDEIQAHVKWSESGVDTQAPSPPETVNAAAGDKHIFLDWMIDSDVEEEDTYGFAFFCVPAGTSSGNGAGGAGGAGGNDDCPQEVLSAGKLPDEDMLQYICGNQIGRTAREGQADGVENGITYAVAIAATDTVRNNGRLSAISCATPNEVTTFFERYKEVGGKGGGGFCSQGGEPNSGLLALLAGALLLYLGRRRRSSQQPRRSQTS